MAFPTITTLPDAPQRGEVADTFTTKANAFVAALSTLESDINAWTTYAQGTFTNDLNAIKDAAQLAETNAETYKNAAEGFKDSAEEAVTDAQEAVSDAQEVEAAFYSLQNFKGLWSDLTGAINTPASVKHNGVFWLLLNNLADVTVSEPSTTNTDWTKAKDDVETIEFYSYFY